MIGIIRLTYQIVFICNTIYGPIENYIKIPANITTIIYTMVIPQQEQMLKMTISKDY